MKNVFKKKSTLKLPLKSESRLPDNKPKVIQENFGTTAKNLLLTLGWGDVGSPKVESQVYQQGRCVGNLRLINSHNYSCIGSMRAGRGCGGFLQIGNLSRTPPPRMTHPNMLAMQAAVRGKKNSISGAVKGLKQGEGG